MNEGSRFVPPGVEFDPRLANELARWETTLPTAIDETCRDTDRRDPFNGYVRMLTPQGGILIHYWDQNRSLLLMILRILAFILATWVGGWLIFFVASLSGLQCLPALALLVLIDWFIVNHKFKVSHSVEIRPDAMIIDGEDVFYAEDIGDNWPALQMKDGDPDQMVICGVCGTRFIEYMTANRLDENDRTPEVLAADLKVAIEQLWGRREVTFATGF